MVARPEPCTLVILLDSVLAEGAEVDVAAFEAPVVGREVIVLGGGGPKSNGHLQISQLPWLIIVVALVV